MEKMNLRKILQSTRVRHEAQNDNTVMVAPYQNSTFFDDFRGFS